MPHASQHQVQTQQPTHQHASCIVPKPPQTFKYTTDEAVRAVYPEVGDFDVAAAIQTAEAMIDANIVLNGCGANYSPETLEMIARYLSAHIFQIQHGVLSSQTNGNATENYTATLDKGLMGTLHGQQAMLLDTCGCLAQMQARMNAILDGQLNSVPVIDVFPQRYSSFGTRAGRRY